MHAHHVDLDCLEMAAFIQELTDVLGEKASELRGMAKRCRATVVDSDVFRRKNKSRSSASSTPMRSSSNVESLEQESMYAASTLTNLLRRANKLQKHLKVHHSTTSVKDTLVVLAS